MFTPTTPREGPPCLVLGSTLLDWRAEALGRREVLVSLQIHPVVSSMLFLAPDAGPGAPQNCHDHPHPQEEQTESPSDLPKVTRLESRKQNQTQDLFYCKPDDLPHPPLPPRALPTL